MHMRKFPAWALMVLVLALVAAACSGGDGGGEDGGGQAGAEGGTEDTGGGGSTEDIVSTYIGEPESLTTTNNNESEGNAVLSGLYTTLVEYDPESVEPVNAVAESIETEDNQTFTVTLKEGWTFHNGEPVTAQSFVDAWNYGAYGPNAQQTAAFFSGIAGFEDLQCGTTTETQTDEETGEEVEAEVADCENSPPAAEELSGLTVNSDTEFTIELSAPQSFFVTRLGYEAYAPLPEAFFEDPEGFNEQPIGNGPLMMDGPWQHNQVINTVAYPDYAGDNPMQVGGVEFRIYDDVNTAVQDLLAGNLDIVDQVPPERWPEVEGQVPNADTSPTSSITYLGFPMYDDRWGGEENQALRAALSQAIDREAINQAIFNGTRAGATNFLTPALPGYQENVQECENWTFDPEAAQQKFDEAGGLEGGFTVYYNAGAAHEQWIQAVVNQWAQNLGIEAESVQFEGVQPFGDYLQRLDSASVDGPFRLGWGMDYPHPQNFLQLVLDPDFLPADGGANSTFYDSEEFNQAVDDALAQTDLESSIPLWQDAVSIACNDVPLIPIYYQTNLYGWSENVSNVFVDAFGNVIYTQLEAGA
jgi:oligopeptide transport system substrate-binding protein